MVKALLYILIIAGGIYLLICGMLYLYQDKFIFFPPLPKSDIYSLVKQNEVSFTSPLSVQGVALQGEKLKSKKIHGWKINIRTDATRTILYFGGNAEDVVYFNQEAQGLQIRQAIAFNHPGYGSSEGYPSQQSFYQNALEVYDYALKEYQLKPDEIIIMGRSLGSSAAAYLAANRENAGLVLVTPFDSIENIAAQRFKYFPIKLILKHPFYTINSIKQIKSNILILAAENDEMIGRVHLENLIIAAGRKTKVARYSEVGHNTVQTHPEYYNELNRFIGELQ